MGTVTITCSDEGRRRSKMMIALLVRRLSAYYDLPAPRLAVAWKDEAVEAVGAKLPVFLPWHETARDRFDTVLGHVWRTGGDPIAYIKTREAQAESEGA